MTSCKEAAVNQSVQGGLTWGDTPDKDVPEEDAPNKDSPNKNVTNEDPIIRHL